MLGAIAGIAGAGASILGAMKAGDAADAQAAAAERSAAGQQKLSREQMEYNIYQQQRWESIYGPIQDNLSSYYQGLDPDKFQTQMNVDIGTAYNIAQEQLTASLAARGIQGSGVEAAALAQLEQGRADALSQTRVGAEEQVAGMQSSFLGMGLGQQAGLRQGVNQAFGAGQQAFGNLANFQMGMAQQYGASAGGFMQTAGNLLGKVDWSQFGGSNQTQLGVASNTGPQTMISPYSSQQALRGQF